MPVFDDDEVPRFFMLAKAHQADCGNALPTTYMGHARDVYEEGALIFPARQGPEDYRNIDDIIRICRMRIRVPEQWWGDYLAALGAVRIGEREMQELGREVGWDTLARYAEDWFDYSEQRMIAAIRRLPSGTVTAHSAHDPFPGVPDGIPTKVTLTVDAENAKITVDLRDNPDCQPCGLNLTQGTATTAAMVGVYNGIIDHTVPPNAGSFRRVDILLRENCCCGIPKHPYSCSVATTNLADRVSGPVQTAIAETRRRLWHGRDRADHPGRHGRDLGHGPAPWRCALRQPDLPRLHRRGRHAGLGRVPVDHPRRQRRHVPP